MTIGGKKMPSVKAMFGGNISGNCLLPQVITRAAFNIREYSLKDETRKKFAEISKIYITFSNSLKVCEENVPYGFALKNALHMKFRLQKLGK